MKIAQLHPYPPELPDQIPVLPGGIAQGGSETSSFRYALELSRMGHEVTYYVAKYPGITTDRLRLNDKFELVYLNTIFKNVGPAFSLKLFFELLKGNYDVIQSHQIPTNFSLIGGIAARIKRKPFIITFHGRLPALFLDKWVGTLASLLSDAVTVQNAHAYELVQSFAPKRKLVIIPHGIDTSLFRSVAITEKYRQKYNPDNKQIILFVGRMIPPKGVDVLLEAVLKLQNQGREVCTLLCGDGPNRQEYEQLAKKLGVSNSVRFMGSVQQQDLPQLYALSDVFVLPSTYHNQDGSPIANVSENFGLVIAESMSCGTPVVAARVGGIPLWIDDGRVARLFEERNSDDLADKLSSTLYGSKDENQRLVKDAKSMIDDKYSWQAVIRQFEPLFNKEAS